MPRLKPRMSVEIVGVFPHHEWLMVKKVLTGLLMTVFVQLPNA